ncbi:unnamed protein product [Fructobacillus evanidus]|uniref:Uncharacterized protein n=1 Tax=Fructobacillus evanidus TaxID=3064281 RepID=A0ABM9MZZ2_9LACO|nr:unnamed protein product [Fructobacillus sp. LMG 32999]CAK1251837.1 unnamed protein product [Fructobacillus sp. LMG 32999]
MATVACRLQPKLNKREVELIEIVQEVGLGRIIKNYLHDELSDDDLSDDDLINVDFDDIGDAYVLGYEEMEE